MSLAEELLADLGEEGEEEGEDEEEREDEAGEDDDIDQDESQLAAEEVRAGDGLRQETNDPLDLLTRVKTLPRLLKSKRLQDVLVAIDHFSLGASVLRHDGQQIEDHDEYQLIVSANNLLIDLENEILICYRFVKDHYNKHFPGLEDLVLNPIDYVKSARVLGNSDDLSHDVQDEDIIKQLRSFLTSPTVMVVSVQGAGTEPKKLGAEDWKTTQEGIEMTLDLDKARDKILAYVESRMVFLAPNLSTLVGSTTAAKLIGVTGGLKALSAIPSCNVQLLGQNKLKTAQLGLGSASLQRHTGFIFHSPLIQSQPPEIRYKAAKAAAAKIVLAARVDTTVGDSAYTDGSLGQKWRDELEGKFDKLCEPAPAKHTKALPVPDEGDQKKRRGGRRRRAQKDSMAETALRRQQNRLKFGTEAEEEMELGAGEGDEIEGMGMIGSESGRLRRAAVDQRSRAKVSKRRTNLLKTYGGSSASGGTLTGINGLASTISFTPMQGLELVDPSRIKAQQAKLDKANDGLKSYFNAGGGLRTSR